VCIWYQNECGGKKTKEKKKKGKGSDGFAFAFAFACFAEVYVCAWESDLSFQIFLEGTNSQQPPCVTHGVTQS